MTDTTTPSGDELSAGKLPPDTVTARAWRLVSAYAATQPPGMTARTAVHAIARRAIESGEFTDYCVQAALVALGRRDRPVTLQTLTAELRRPPVPAQVAILAADLHFWEEQGETPGDQAAQALAASYRILLDAALDNPGMAGAVYTAALTFCRLTR